MSMPLHRPVILAAATPMELRAALAPMVENMPPVPAEGETATIRAGGRGVVLLVTGVGPLNAAYSMGRALGEVSRCMGVVNVGIAGSYDAAAVPVGSVALAVQEIYPEYGVSFDDRIDHEGVGLAQAKGPDGGVWEKLQLYPRTAAEEMGLQTSALENLPHVGFLTSGRVSGSCSVAASLRDNYGVLVENMEGFALGLAALRAGVPFLELRAISNVCGEREKAAWDIRGALSALGEACTALFAS